MIEVGLTTGEINSHYAPVAVLLSKYVAEGRVEPLQAVGLGMRTREFSPADKLMQVMVSMMAGCRTLWEVNEKLKHEHKLAQVGGWPRFADQSSLARTLDKLTQMQIEHLQGAIHSCWYPGSGVQRHNWHGYLWLDFDLSGLPCGARAQESQRGFFSEKKT